MMRYEDLWRSIAGLYDDGEARAVVRLVLETRFGMTTTDIYCGGMEQLSAADEAALADIMLRLRAGQPVQYALGEATFCDRSYLVAPGVLIPRPETEELCAWIEDWTAAQTSTADSRKGGRTSILDICTGSGCIAITLDLDIPTACVEAWDISDEALTIARKNSIRLGSAANMRHQDALHAPEDSDKWDVIVSNPPYICEQERAAMDAHVVEHEPWLALFVPDNDALLFYRAIAIYASTALKAGGALFFEVNTLYANDVAELLREHGFHGVEVRHDQWDKARFVMGMRPKEIDKDVLLRLTTLCSQGEHCSHEMVEKMRKWGVDDEQQALVMAYLTANRFVDDERFALAFALDKVRYNKWGRRKVDQALWAKHVDSGIRTRILDSIDDEEYLKVLRPMLKSKLRSIKAANDYERNCKLMRFALGRGFDMKLIRQCVSGAEEIDIDDVEDDLE